MVLFKKFEKSEQALAHDYEVVRDEHDIINQRRAGRFGFRRDVTNPQTAPEAKNYLQRGVFDTVGLALSGGGIRSAAFCLGAMQAMAKHKLMQHIDYMSTVSGGGYIGLSASLNMNKDGKSFPFFERQELKDTDAVKLLRDRSNYLRAGHILPTLENVAIYVRGIVANIMIVLPVLLLLASFTLYCNPTWLAMHDPDIFGWSIPPQFPRWDTFGLTPYAAIACLLLYAAWAVGISRVSSAGLNEPSLKVARFLLPTLLVIAFLELQPFILTKMVSSGPAIGPPRLTGDLFNWLIGLGTPLLTAAALFSKNIGDMFKTGQGQGQGSWIDTFKRAFGATFVWIVAGLVLPLFLWLGYLLLVYWGVQWGSCSTCYRVAWLATPLAPSAKYIVFALILFGLSLLLEPNSNSLHRLYRDRLADAFCPEMKDAETGYMRPVKISELDGNGPYNLINTTLNVQADPKINQRGRNGEFFVFSPAYVGSVATKFASTRLVEEKLVPELDVATAMAISGAAASSNMGSESIRPLRFTLAFFNVRLGFWFPNVTLLLGRILKPTFWYFLYEATGSLSSQKNLLYLTDGGHIENLGVYELLRRRCKVIFAVDGEADPEMNFGALVKLQRFARIDFGARIDMEWSEIRKRSLAVQKADGSATRGPHCAIGKIEYENGAPGILVYIKSSVTGDENGYVLDYNRRFKAFPHETTGDQFFNEEQFEVYRALGFHAVHGMCCGDHSVQVTVPGSHPEDAATLETLFSRDTKGYGLAEIRALLGRKIGQAQISDATVPQVKSARNRTGANLAKRSRPSAKQSKRRIPKRLPKSI